MSTNSLANKALNDKIPKIKVDILVDNVAIQQYEDDEENQGSPDSVTKYTEAKSGAEFAVQHRFSRRNRNMMSD